MSEYLETTGESAARLRRMMGPPQDLEKGIIREWPGLSRDEASTLYAALYAVDSYPDPKADGKPISGTYRVSDLVVERDPALGLDGPVTIVQTLLEGWVKSADSLPSAQVVKDKDELLSPFTMDQTSESTNVVEVYRGIDPAYAQTLAATISLTGGVLSASVEKQPDGSCRIYTVTETRTWNGTKTTKRSRIIDQYGEEGALIKGHVVDTYTHIGETSISALETWFETEDLDVPDANYLIDRVEFRLFDAGYGEITRIQSLTDSTAPTTGESGNELTIGNPDAFVGAGKFIIYRWPKVETALLDAALTALQTPPSGYAVDYVTFDGNRLTDTSVTIRQRLSKINPNTLNNGYVDIAVSVDVSRPVYSSIREWPDITKTLCDTIVGDPASYAPSGLWVAYRTEKLRQLNGNFTARVHYGIFARAAGTGTDHLTTGDITRKEIEKKYDSSVDQGYQWRVITETYRQKWTGSATSAATYASAGKSGSYVKYLGDGEWFAEKITDRSVGAFSSDVYDGS